MSKVSGRWLIVLTGPVGAGKTTTAGALARRLRAEGRSAAAIDLDLIYGMARQVDGFGDESTWRISRNGAAALADAFFAQSIEVVVVEGSVHNRDDYEEVSCSDSDVQTLLVALDVSFDEAARRVEADPAPDRVLSRDVSILRWLHRQFSEAMPYLRDHGIVVDADEMTPEELSGTIARHLA